MNDILVSISCITYNHEQYIRDALESFLNQKTNFSFEILVHDDASKDKTSEIIREYQKKYPQIIKPIIQEINQHSQGIKVSDFNYKRAEGKYIAICEGDDYWIDEYKLQKQVDYMESHPDCTICYTNGFIEDQNDKTKQKIFIPYSEQDKLYYKDNIDKIFTLDNIYEQSFVPTASFLFPKNILKKLPVMYIEKKCPNGDLKLKLFLAAMGYAYFLNDVTCVYRSNVPNSAMTSWKRENKTQRYDRIVKVVDMINDVDVFTGYRYTESLRKIKDTHIVGLLSNADSFSILKNPDYKRAFKSYTLFLKLRIIIKILIPNKLLNYIYRKSRL